MLDKGYHSNDVLVILKDVEVRSYCSEPDRGRRNWNGKEEEQSAVYQNRRRIRGERGKRLLRQRGELVERSFAHMYETGGMRRTHLRRHDNIIKRLLIHAGAFNLSLIMRKITGRGTPRGFQGRPNALTLIIQMLVWFLTDAAQQLKPQLAKKAVTFHENVTPLRLPHLCLILGAPLTFRRRLTPSIVAGIPDARFTSIVPTQLVRLLDGGADLRHFRAILVGGSGMDAALARAAAAAGAAVVPTYGMTETCGGVVYAGRPLAGIEVRASTDGELLVRGPTLMRGYRLDPDATAAAFDGDGWLRTGDGGDVGADGTVHVLGKLADVIVSGGEKIWPAEVEAALAGHPDVAAVVVSGSADREWGQRVVARVVPRNRSAPPSLESLRSHAAATIAPHKLPRDLIIVEDLDRTALGKIRRR